MFHQQGWVFLRILRKISHLQISYKSWGVKTDRTSIGFDSQWKEFNEDYSCRQGFMWGNKYPTYTAAILCLHVSFRIHMEMDFQLLTQITTSGNLIHQILVLPRLTNCMKITILILRTITSAEFPIDVWCWT